MATKLHETDTRIEVKQQTPAKAEEHLSRLVQSGDWEILQSAPAFALRSPEGQVQLITEALDVRIAKLVKNQGVLVNGSEKERAAAIGVVQRIKELRTAKMEILENLYSQHPRVIASKSQEGKVEFDR